MSTQFNTFQGMPQVQQDIVASFLDISSANALGATRRENVKLMKKSDAFKGAEKIEKAFFENTCESRYEVASAVSNYDYKLRERKWNILKFCLMTLLAISLCASPFVGVGLILGGILAGKITIIVMPILMVTMFPGWGTFFSSRYYDLSNDTGRPAIPPEVQMTLSTLSMRKDAHNTQFLKLYNKQQTLEHNPELLKMIRSWEAERIAKKAAEKVSAENAAKKQVEEVIVNQIHADQVD